MADLKAIFITALIVVVIVIGAYVPITSAMIGDTMVANPVSDTYAKSYSAENTFVITQGIDTPTQYTITDESGTYNGAEDYVHIIYSDTAIYRFEFIKSGDHIVRADVSVLKGNTTESHPLTVDTTSATNTITVSYSNGTLTFSCPVSSSITTYTWSVTNVYLINTIIENSDCYVYMGEIPDKYHINKDTIRSFSLLGNGLCTKGNTVTMGGGTVSYTDHTQITDTIYGYEGNTVPLEVH